MRGLSEGRVLGAGRSDSPAKYTRSRDISRVRIQALGALSRLGREADWARIEALREDPDANVVDAVLRLLDQRPPRGAAPANGGQK